MIYLDNAATSFPKPEAVYQALDRFARHHARQPRPRRAQDGPRRRARPRRRPPSAQPVLPRQAPERFVFTLNCTDALNMAFKGVLADGDHVITTDLEHNSVSRPLRALAMAGRITLTRIAGRRRRHRRSRRRSPAAITPKTRLIAMTHASNVLGTVQPIARDRPHRPRARPALPGRRRPDRRRHSDRRAGHEHRPARLPRPQVAARADRHRRAVRRPASDSCGPGARAAPAATRPARRSRREFPYYLEGGTPNVLGVAGLVAGLDYVEERGPGRDPPARGRTVRPAVAATRRKSAASRSSATRDPARRVGTVSFRCEMHRRRRSSAASSIRRSTSRSGPACTAPRTSTGRSAPSRTAPSASAPGRSTPTPTSTASSRPSRR